MIEEWAMGLMESMGAVGAGVAIALENLFPPLPSELILPLAGFTASQGDMNLLAAVVCTTLGALVGAYAFYGIGALLGRDRAVALAVRLPLLRLSDIERTEAWFERHGTKAVFLGRMVPLFRSFISLPAGVSRMPVLTFGLLTAFGSLIWNSLFILGGYALGENWHRVTDYVRPYSKAVLAVVVLGVAVFAVTRLLRTGRGSRRASR
ncbi:DedA family protein [Streptomyces phytohabitans]|uniref:DedA family protein n=1 Tax=Streptomyces phytohabitans TaxID=1150371 RepID=UPI00345C224A